MRIPNRTSLVTYGVLGLATGLSFLLPDTLTVTPASAQVGPAEYQLHGIVRDFLSTHPDFDVVPAEGFGHYAGNIEEWLPLGTNRPVFAGGGYKVASEWVDLNGRPIAPHLAGVQGGAAAGTGTLLGVRVSNLLTVGKGSFIDGYDSNYGPYGFMGNFGADVVASTNSVAPASITLDINSFIRGDVYVGVGGDPVSGIQNLGIITGTKGALDEAFTIPDITVPVNDEDGDDLQSFQAFLDVLGPMTLTGDTNLEDDSDVPAMWNGGMHVTDLSVLTINGDLRIRVDGDLLIEGEIVLLPDSALTIYVSGDVTVKSGARVNMDSGDSTLVALQVLGAGAFEIKTADISATVVAPDRELAMSVNGNLYGSFLGDSLTLDKGNIHVDVGNIFRGRQNFGIAVRDKIEVESTSLIDGFDSQVGPYGGGNITDAFISTNSRKGDHVKVNGGSMIQGTVLVGPGGDPDHVIDVDGSSSITGDRGVLAAPIGIPLVTPPTVGANLGHLHWTDGVPRTINADLRCKHLKLENGTIVTIEGDVTIRCDGKVEIKKNSEIRLAPGATLTMYIKKDLKVEEGGKLNVNTGDPARVWVPRMGYGKKGKVHIKKNAEVVAWIQGTKSELIVEDNSFFTGSFVGKKAKVKGNSALHVDSAYFSACANIADTFGVAGALSNEAITSPETFGQWYQDVLGVNQAKVHSITMVRNGGGVYEYLNSGFYPIDGQLLGNEGGTRNDYFTYVLGADFTYDACVGQFIDFQGGDGTWLYVNNQLVIDLGGVTPFDTQYIELDRLGLADGETYRMHVFYAHRNAFSAVFRLRTNLELESSGVPPITAMFD